MITSFAAAPKFLGLVELDPAGTVLYSRPDADADKGVASDICGSNFYTDVEPFENVEEFRRHLNGFVGTENPAESFTFTCRYADGEELPVRVLLARMRERSAEGNRTKSVLVHIKRA